jgi:hypothetical protein
MITVNNPQTYDFSATFFTSLSFKCSRNLLRAISLPVLLFVLMLPGMNIQAATPLFDGKMTEDWQEYAAAGGNFKKFTQFRANQLVVDVPAGSNWGKTGIRSTNPVVKVPGSGQSMISRVAVVVDKEHTSNITLALVAEKGARDDWHNHDIRLGIDNDSDEKQLNLTLWIKRKEVMKAKLESSVLDVINMVLRPDGVFLVTDHQGGILLQGLIPGDYPADGYHLYAFSHPSAQNLPTKLALVSIEVTEESFVLQGDPAEFLADTQKTIVFDGQVLGRRWTGFNAHGGNYGQHAKLINGKLVVDVPEKSSWGKVGLMSPEPVVWLDKFNGDAQVSLTFKFDSKLTTGFVIALTPNYGLNGNDPGKPRYLMHWRQTPDGKIKAMSVINDKDHVIETEMSAPMPEVVTLVLSPQGIKAVATGFPDTVTPWSELKLGQGFRVYVYSHPDANHQPVKMALKEILLERNAGILLAEPRPAAGVAPLPVNVLFDGKPGDLWELASAYGPAFNQYSKFENDQLVVEIPKNKTQWGKVGLLSNEPVLKLDDRTMSTSHKITVKVDPKKTSGFQIMFNGRKVAAMWGQHMQAAVSFIRITEGEAAGKHVLGLRKDNGPYRVWGRTVDSQWVDKNWDGVLEIENGDRWMAVHIPGGPSLRGSEFGLTKGSEMFMTVYAHPEKNGRASQLALERIESEWVMPDGMTRMDRWIYVDKEDFDANKFLDELATDVFMNGSNAAISEGE